VIVVHKDRKVLSDRKVHLVHKVLLVLLDHKDHQDHLELD